jgi:hypothetical protein
MTHNLLDRTHSFGDIEALLDPEELVEFQQGIQEITGQVSAEELASALDKYTWEWRLSIVASRSPEWQRQYDAYLAAPLPEPISFEDWVASLA